jgi:hypothetical protein
MKKLKRRKISRKGLHKKAWDLMSELVRRIEKGVCYTCGKKGHWKTMQAGHFVHGKRMDFYMKNIHCQCPRCNKFLSGNLGEYARHLIKDFGPDVIEEIYQAKALNYKKYITVLEYNALIEELEHRLQKINEQK